MGDAGAEASDTPGLEQRCQHHSDADSNDGDGINGAPTPVADEGGCQGQADEKGEDIREGKSGYRSMEIRQSPGRGE